MGPRIRAQAVVAALAAAVAGCATAPAPIPPTKAGGLSCEPLERKVEFPRTESPEAWTPTRSERRGFVSLRFLAVGEGVYAIGIPLHDEDLEKPSKGEPEKPWKPFVVGPMWNLPSDMPKGKALEMGRKDKGWHTFYKKLYGAFGGSRPLALVCPSPADCPITPESPPPGLLGMTASYGSGSFVALEPIPVDRAYAARADGDGGQTATDAVQIAPPPVKHLPDEVLRPVIADTVARAVCAARILTVPDPTKLPTIPDPTPK